MRQFDNQHIVITGGTRGIGKALAKAFLQQGGNVLVIYSSNEQAVEKMSQELAEFSDKLSFAKFDISNAEAVEKFFSCFPFSKLDVLVNNAGIRRDQIVGMMSFEDWKRVIDINLNGSFYMSKFAVLEMMKNRYGRIINITSPCSHFGFQGQANYAASKAGQIGLMRSLSKEVAKRKITVNCVSPGFIDTELINDLPEELVAQYKKQIPLKEFGKVEDIANAVLFLALPTSSYITGTTLEVTGGL